jgi:hypothetical protein
MVYTLRFFPLQNAVCFIILTYLVPVLFTFYIQCVLKLKKNNPGAKRLRGTFCFQPQHQTLHLAIPQATHTKLLWAITLRAVVIRYPPCRTAYQSHDDGTDSLSRNVGKLLILQAA